MIAFVSEFVQRMYYRLAVSKDGTLDGFILNSLSLFDMEDFESDSTAVCSSGMSYCRYALIKARNCQIFIISSFICPKDFLSISPTS